MAAVRQARTHVCEPVHRFTLDVPTNCVDAALSLVGRLGGVLLTTEYAAAYSHIVGHIPATRVHVLTSRLPDISGGAGAITSELDHYRPVHGDPPERPQVGPGSPRLGGVVQRDAALADCGDRSSGTRRGPATGSRRVPRARRSQRHRPGAPQRRAGLALRLDPDGHEVRFYTVKHHTEPDRDDVLIVDTGTHPSLSACR